MENKSHAEKSEMYFMIYFVNLVLVSVKPLLFLELEPFQSFEGP